MKIVTSIVIVAVIALYVGFVPIVETTSTLAEPLSCQVTEHVEKEQLAPELQSLILSTIAFETDQDKIDYALQQAYQEFLVGYVSVQNTDTVSGVFDVHIVFSTTAGDQYAEDVSLQLESGEQKEAKYGVSSIDANIDELSWDHKVTPDTKTVTQDKKVPIFRYLLSEF